MVRRQGLHPWRKPKALIGKGANGRGWPGRCGCPLRAPSRPAPTAAKAGSFCRWSAWGARTRLSRPTRKRRPPPARVDVRRRGREGYAGDGQQRCADASERRRLGVGALGGSGRAARFRPESALHGLKGAARYLTGSFLASIRNASLPCKSAWRNAAPFRGGATSHRMPASTGCARPRQPRDHDIHCVSTHTYPGKRTSCPP